MHVNRAHILREINKSFIEENIGLSDSVKSIDNYFKIAIKELTDNAWDPVKHEEMSMILFNAEKKCLQYSLDLLLIRKSLEEIALESITA